LKKDDGSFYLSVQYQLDNTKHGMIPISDVTAIPLDLRQSRSELKRKAVEDCGRDAQKIAKTTISQSFKAKSKIEILKSALSEGLVKKKRKGWHRLEFGLNEELENNANKFAQAVWNLMPSCDIARSFVLSYRTAKKIVEVKGDNCFLSGKKGGLHANVRKDFMDTETGIVRRDDKILEAPKVTREIRKLQNTCHIAKGHQIELRESGKRVEESAEI